MATHTYRATLSWEGSTGAGYPAYDRSHQVVPAPGTSLTMSADPAFRGDPALPNPESLLLAAASSCQLLSFLAVAARARLDVVRYTDEAVAEMPEDDPPVRITWIQLKPRITVRGIEKELFPRVERLVRLAHDECYIANTLTARVDVEPMIEVAD